MQKTRRSGRIAKEVPILLLGTDTVGTVFSEETKTVVLSRHGAGIISKYRFSPDETLTMRLPGTSKEAEVRLAGQIGGEPGRYVYGVAFVDPNLDFWPMEFPPPEPFEPASRRAAFECTLCHWRQECEHDEIEEDVYSVNGNVLRFCSRCGTSTPWQKARGESISNANMDNPVATQPSSGESSLKSLLLSGQRVPASPTPLFVPQPAPASAPPNSISGSALSNSVGPSVYSGASIEVVATSAVNVAVADLSSGPEQTQQPATAVLPGSPRPVGGNGQRINRRKHLRIRVTYNACVKQGESGEEIVECENVSKGGLCFHSRQRYPLDSRIEVAAPFSPGEAALFVPAKITRVEPIAGGQLFRYGVAYVKSSSQAPAL